MQFGSFKQKQVRCPLCKKIFFRHEEKETDVAVAVKMLEIFHRNDADRVVLVTGDTDIAPAVRTAKTLFPDRQVCFAFPWNRKMKELAKLADSCFSMDRAQYVKHQYPDLVLLNGRSYQKPATW